MLPKMSANDPGTICGNIGLLYHCLSADDVHLLIKFFADDTLIHGNRNERIFILIKKTSEKAFRSFFLAASRIFGDCINDSIKSRFFLIALLHTDLSDNAMVG